MNYGIKFIFPTVLLVHNILEEYPQVAREHINFDITGWGAVLRPGHGQNVHLLLRFDLVSLQVHPGSMYAGVYYVTVPPEVGRVPNEGGGCIQFLDPRGGAPMMQLVRGKNFYGSGAVQVCPPHGGGLLIMFPSWLQHEVKPLPTEFTGPRIAISFNIVFKGMK